MIKYPYLQEQASSRQVIDTFKGYNRNLRIGSGEFSEMENLTSDDYPVLSVRKKRGLVTFLQDSGYTTGGLYVPGTGLIISANHQQDNSVEEYGALYLLEVDGYVRNLCAPLSPGSKSLALMGKYLIVAPDMKWVDIQGYTRGDIGKKLELKTGDLILSLYMTDGTVLNKGAYGPDAPADPQSFSHWVDTSVKPYQVKRYSPAKGEWILLENAYVRLSGDPLRDHGFSPGDGVNISGLGLDGNGVTDGPTYGLNGYHTILECPDQDSFLIQGVLTGGRVHSCAAGPVSITREVPEMDFVVESGNRLWGCSQNSNHIYACKLGDFKNWNCFQRLSTDSWVGNVGTPGAFTGAAVQNGYPVFYKENCKHKVWPSATGTHQITTAVCHGVEKGSENSIAVFEGTVFYKSAFGIFADDGGGFTQIGQALADGVYRNAFGAVYDRKYYLNMEDSQGKRALFVYDITRRMWHRQNGVYRVMAAGGDGIYSLDGGDVWDLSGNTGTPEDEVSWFAVTGDLGLERPEQKYITRLTLRLSLDPGATLEVYAQYDREQTWVKLGQVYGTDLRSFSLPVRPRRCDQLRLKLQGKGMCKIYSITKTMEKGSELP